MALVPYLLHDLLDHSYNPMVVRIPRRNRELAELQQLAALADRLISQQGQKATVHFGDDGFKVNLDVQQFKPEEVNVKVVDNFIVVEGNHEERQDEHGFISRKFQRRYHIPDDIDVNQIASKLSSDGVLTIGAPKKQAVPLPASNERIIPIIHTQAPAVKPAPKQAPQQSEEKDKQPQ